MIEKKSVTVILLQWWEFGWIIKNVTMQNIRMVLKIDHVFNAKYYFLFSFDFEAKYDSDTFTCGLPY